MSYLEKMDGYLDSLKVGKSALVDSWFMMSSPMPILAVVVAYLVLVRLGPRLMKNRPPLRVTKLMGYYNAAQVTLSVLICIKTLNLPHLFHDGILYTGCRYPSNTQNYQLLDVGWWYFFAKFTELLDTLFFVLRKKEKQVTFLHVYHHAVMAVYSWSYLKFAAGGEGAILGFLNSAVHVVMYTYYLLAGLGPRFHKYLWWKKYVTKMQLLQFVIMLAYCAVTHFSPRCQYTSGFTYFISGNVVVFMFLFLNFYSKSYKKQRSAEKEIKEEFARTRNGYDSTNGLVRNGAAKKCNKTENGYCGNGCKNNAKETRYNGVEDYPFEVNKFCGDYTKDGKIYLTRRTAATTFGPEYDFNSIIKK